MMIGIITMALWIITMVSGIGVFYLGKGGEGLGIIDKTKKGNHKGCLYKFGNIGINSETQFLFTNLFPRQHRQKRTGSSYILVILGIAGVFFFEHSNTRNFE